MSKEVENCLNWHWWGYSSVVEPRLQFLNSWFECECPTLRIDSHQCSISIFRKLSVINATLWVKKRKLGWIDTVGDIAQWRCIQQWIGRSSVRIRGSLIFDYNNILFQLSVFNDMLWVKETKITRTGIVGDIAQWMSILLQAERTIVWEPLVPLRLIQSVFWKLYVINAIFWVKESKIA